MVKRRRRLPSQDPNDPDYRRLRYVRYCDDWLLGFAGPRNAFEQIKTRIGAFLRAAKSGAHHRIDAGKAAGAAGVRLIRVLTGIGAYLPHRHDDGELLHSVLSYLVRLTEPQATIGPQDPFEGNWPCLTSTELGNCRIAATPAAEAPCAPPPSPCAAQPSSTAPLSGLPHLRRLDPRCPPEGQVWPVQRLFGDCGTGGTVVAAPAFLSHRRRTVGGVTLADVTRPGVLAAVEEFDRVGRDAFLRSSGFGRSRAYYLDHGGRLYDSKPIIGYAHGVSTGTALRSDDFTGGDKTVARRLETLGFTVAFLPNPDWTRDEIILACALVEANGWRQLDANDPRVRELSALLQSPAIHPGRRNPDFRNPAGVALKTYNIVTTHPSHSGSSSNGNRLDREVMEDFRTDPARMHAIAARIRELLAAHPDALDLPDPDLDEASATEGGVALRAHLRRERDRRLRQKKLADARRRGIPIACEACGFDFGHIYGALGVDYIECHHRTPLHVSGQTQTRLNDLALLCCNCHRMIHHSRPWLLVEELRDLVQAQRKLHACQPRKNC